MFVKTLIRSVSLKHLYRDTGVSNDVLEGTRQIQADDTGMKGVSPETFPYYQVVAYLEANTTKENCNYLTINILPDAKKKKMNCSL